MASIVFWTRLEPYSRQDDIELGLQAQLHDPLWMLARQWQNGEFQGEDSGTPVQARLRLERSPLARYHPGAWKGERNLPGFAYRSEIPLEALVEREPVQLSADPRRDLRLAAEAGLYFLRLLDGQGAPAIVRTRFIQEPAYRLLASPEDGAPFGAHTAGQDQAGANYLAIMSGRVPDGFKLYEALRPALRPEQGGAPALPAKPALPAAQRQRVIRAGLAYLDWFEARYSVPPDGPPTWNAERMEYAFTISAASSDGELALDAPEYPGGSLDWYSFNLNTNLRLGVQASDPQPEMLARTLLPNRVRYPGMAADRWWEFEDAGVNFSRIEGDPDELMRLLLVQFAMVYSNDWYVLPVDLSLGAIYRTRSLVVTDAFGERTLVQHYSALDQAPRDWRMFTLSPSARASLSTAGARLGEDALFLPPVLAASLHGDPIEEVLFLRDEVANLVWAVERLAPALDGSALNRVEIYNRREREAPEPAPEGEEAPAGERLGYLLATTTPDHWIPFLPARIDPSLPDIRLRRAKALLEQLDPAAGGLPAFSRPLGRILEPERQDLSLFEEEVPRSGIFLTRRFQYARWLNGATYLWLARAKGQGKGESTAGLYFDQVE